VISVWGLLIKSGPYERRRAERAAIAMSTIEEVRAAETRVQMVLGALKKADAGDPNHLRDELKNATDEYARAVRELTSK
jgi:hypothetical protein